jgi:hypothetical protein
MAELAHEVRTITDALDAVIGQSGVGTQLSTRRYTAVEAGLDPTTLPAGWQAGDGKLASAFVRATKPRSAVPASPHQRGTSRPVPVGSSDRGCCDSTCCT